MKSRLLLLSAILSLLFVFNINAQGGADAGPLMEVDSIYIPTGSQTTAGNGVFTGPLGNTPRTYQMLIHQDELTAVVGKEIKGLSFRLPVAATDPWPASETTYNNYDIYLSGSVAPADRSTTFALNVVGTQTQVRSGSLIIPPAAFPSGGSPNPCGKDIEFNTLWLYTGGHLLIEIRLDGSNGTARSGDAFTTSTPGYLSMYAALWTGTYAGTTGIGANFLVTRLTYDDPVPVELMSFTAYANGKNVELKWMTATESNNKGFQVERSSENNWISAGFVEGFGTTTEIQNYSFTDYNLSPGIYSYRLKQIDYDGHYDYSNLIEVQVNTPGEFSLEQNYPNPFNPETKIAYSIPQESRVIITLYDILGNEITTLVDEQKPSGYYELTWNAGNIPSGIYFYTLQSGNFSASKKLILMK